MKVVTSTEMIAPKGVAFDLMADMRNEPAWNDKVTKTSLDSGEPLGEGSRFATTNRGQQYVAVIEEYNRPDSITFVVTGKPMVTTARLQFSDTPAGVSLRAEFDMRPRGFMRFVLPLMAPAVRKDFPKQMGSFKRYCETKAETLT